jgi:glucose-1-phosphate thymidylyltransferase
MKGVILAGGMGGRLDPCTRVTNKHLLPVFNKPMVYYAIEKMIALGIKDIIMVLGIEFASHFPAILKHGEEFGIKINYVLQDEALGIAHALYLTKDFVKDDSVCVILGDNIFEDNIDISNFVSGARVFLKEVPDPQRFGVATLKENKLVEIEEKPSSPKSNLAVTGIYLYDNNVFNMIKMLKPSKRGEYELTDVNNIYIHLGQMDYKMLKGYWQDAGTFDGLFKASKLVKGE